FFFFQAEDGIRDFHVTGVQTCALPILLVDDGSTDGTASVARTVAREFGNLEVQTIPHGGKAAAVLWGLEHARGDLILFADADLRSEERRVGKECRSRWAADQWRVGCAR